MTTPLQGSRWSTRLQTQTVDATLDLDDTIGQRSATFRFDAVNIQTGYRQRITPISNQPPTLSHDVSRTISRTIDNLVFGEDDTTILNSITTRLELFMLFGGTPTTPTTIKPLGRYMYANQDILQYTAGNTSTGSFYDEMFIVDQEIEHSFGAQDDISGRPGTAVPAAITQLLTGLPITVRAEPTPYDTIGAWPIGTHRGQICNDLAIDGDYFNPWFDNTGIMRWIRAFNPANAIPTFDFDAGNKVLRSSPPRYTNDLITAPNRIIVIGNGALSADQNLSPIVGTYDIPSSAPHSITNRGFVIPKIYNRQIQADLQATAIAANYGQRQTVFERLEIETVPDPRHDSYDVCRWQGQNWLELAWSMQLVEGGKMRHVLRKAYT